MNKFMDKLQKIYGKNYYYAGKDWVDGYKNYDVFGSPTKHPWFFLIEKIKEYKPSGRALDVGCAFGSFLSFLPDDFERFGCDISEFAIQEASKRHKGIEFRVSDISSEKPFNEKFDIITALDVLEHVLDLRTALSNLYEMLKDDGVLVVGVPVASRIHHLLAFFGFSFLTNQDSHIVLTSSKTWKNIIFPEFFSVVEDFPTTFGAKRIPLINLFHVFVLKKAK